MAHNKDENVLSLVNQSVEFNSSDNPSSQTLMVSAFGLSGESRVLEADFTMEDREIQRSFKGKKRRTMSQCAAFLPQSPIAKNEENDASADLGNRDTKKQKSELLFPGQSSSKLAVKEAKDRFNDDDDDDDKKETYIHVRAKRGKATNSHSLAERVRREKISERMRILQDIVPGCNKDLRKEL